MSEGTQDALRTLRMRLAGARGHLKRAAVRRALMRCTEPTLWLMCTCTFVFLLSRASTPFGSNAFASVAYGVMLLVGILAGVTVFVLPAVLREPDESAAAQRLDLATANHNRIATALSFARRTDASPFEQAAIHDGVRTIEILCARVPYAEPVVPRWRRMGISLATFAVLNMLAFIPLGFRSPTGPGAVDDVAGAPHKPAARIAAESAREPTPSQDQLPPTAPTQIEGNLGRQVATASAGLPISQGSPSGAATIGDAARLATRTGQADGGGSTSADSDQPHRQRRARPVSHVDASKRPMAGTRDKVATTASADGDGAGGPGTGNAASSAYDWPSHVAESIAENAEPDEDEIEDDSRTSKQRSGLQAVVKDRNAAPSRDLGLGSGLEGRPGSGRGGPTPMKKSRGTASLVLGVPVPDSVRGRLRAGTTKVARGRTTPEAEPGAVTASASVAPRTLAESPVRRFELPADVLHTVRTFLVSWHAREATQVGTRAMSESTADIELDHE